MAPVRVFAVAPGASEGMMQPDEPAVARVTRSKAAGNVINNEENLVNNNETASQQINDTLHTMGEESTVRMELSPVARTRASDKVFGSEPTQDDDHAEGKFI
jgi:hypothetical protein